MSRKFDPILCDGQKHAIFCANKDNGNPIVTIKKCEKNCAHANRPNVKRFVSYFLGLNFKKEVVRKQSSPSILDERNFPIPGPSNAVVTSRGASNVAVTSLVRNSNLVTSATVSNNATVTNAGEGVGEGEGRIRAGDEGGAGQVETDDSSIHTQDMFENAQRI